jgi:hypothetical protein
MVTVDAMGCQRKIAREMVEADADDVLALKGNQETGQAEVKPFLDATLAEKQGPAPAGSQVIARRRHAGEWGDGGEGSRTLGNPPLLSERGAGLIVPIGIVKRRFRAALLCDGELLGGQLLFQLSRFGLLEILHVFRFVG